jgi:predicted adenylyl cyclase CyaB
MRSFIAPAQGLSDILPAASTSAVSIETEIKLKITDLRGFCLQLNALNPDVLSARHFEDNHLLDFPDQKLKSAQCLLRIRFAEGRGFLTYKGPPLPEGIFKTREELETKLQSGAVALQIFEQIGMRVWFRYQKYRREFALDRVHVAVDETPIGDYVEFEGSEEGIRNLAQRMEIAESQFLRTSYYALYLDYCRQRGETPQFMIFKDSRLEIRD